MNYLLDTTFVIDYLANQPAAVARFAKLFEGGGPIYVTEIGVAELAAGIRDPQLPAVMALLEPLEFIQPGRETALRAGKWRRDSRLAGATLSLPDAVIAAAAYDADATVLTRNVRDFALTPVRVEAY